MKIAKQSEYGLQNFKGGRLVLGCSMGTWLFSLWACGAHAETAVEETLVQGRKSDYSIITENAQKIIDVPGSLGDPLMAVYSLPGVLSEGEGGTPAVRGSSPSDNLYRVDGAPAGYVFHSFSTSIFNENILQDFELYSAGFGPNYGNAIGGVFDIRLRDPKAQPLVTKADLSMLRAGLFVEGEVSDNSAFYVSGRASLLQYFFDKDAAEKEDGIRVQDAPEDTDFQFKYLYLLDDNNKISLSANGASDLAAAEFTEFSTDVMEEPDFAGDAKIDNHFASQALRWQREGESGSQLDIQFGHFDNRNDTFWGGKQYFFNVKNVDDFAIANYQWLMGIDHTLSVGAEVHAITYSYDARLINYVCTEFDPDCALRRGELVAASNKLKLQQQQAYINDHWVVSNSVALDFGVQTHHNDLTEETFYHPRLALSWEFANNWTLSSSAGTYNRLPDIDKLFPEIGNPKLQSPTANHYTLGLKQEWGDEWSWSLTGYYKTMEDLPLARAVDDSSEPFYSNNMSGEAYGVDLFINKGLTDRWYGWLAISASRSNRTNELTKVEAKYRLDTPLVISWVMNYQLNSNWTMGSRLTLQSGQAYTPIIGAQANPYFENHILPIYGEANSDNLPTYTRLDLRFKRDMSLLGYAGTYNIDILNVLNIQNVTERHLDYKRTHSAQDFKLEDEVGMGIIPALGISLTF
jgi:outer membrane receptor protein involved in Fe transport